MLRSAMLASILLSATPVLAAAGTPASKIDMNAATPEQLMTLPGVGDMQVRVIIDGRPYRSVSDLRDILCPDLLAVIAPMIEVRPPQKHPV